MTFTMVHDQVVAKKMCETVTVYYVDGNTIKGL